MHSKLTLITFLFWFTTASIAQTFTEQSSISLPGVYYGSVSWADFDNDNDLDFLLTGRGYFRIYKNNANNTFSLQPGLPFPDVYNSSTDWGDFNNDGYLDILITGELVGGRYTTIFKNNGNGSFVELTGNGLTPMLNSSAVWGDYDNDGFIDVLLSGYSINGNVTKIFHNNGNETFTEKTEIKLKGLDETSAAWGDYDNDGYLDFILTGSDNANYYAIVYKNNRKGNFIEQTSLGLPGVRNGSAIWGDYNNDGLLDILVSGHTGSAYISKVYKNNGNGSFSVQNDISIMGQRYGHTAWGDLNNDGYLDIFLIGTVGTTQYTKIYINNKNNTFTELSGIPMPGLDNGCIALGDYDNDNDLDVLLMGIGSSTSITKIYRNEIITSNEVPLSLSDLSEDLSSGALLKWSDGLNLNKGLSYNVRVGKTSGASDIVSPTSSTTGFYRKAMMGNAQSKQSFLLPNLKKGTYYWSVQAIDNSFIGGAFAPERSFVFNVDLQASNLTTEFKQSASVKCSWTRGNGDNCLVFAKEKGTGTASPENGNSYTGNKAFGSGTQIGSTGWFCVYNGDKDTATVYNLKPNTVYTFHVVEYSGTAGAEIYYTTTGAANPAQYLPPFSEETQIPLTGVSGRTSAWGDYDNDGDLDLILGGNNGTAQIVELYKNNGDNTFTKSPASFDVNTVYDIKWGDYDNDNDLDLLILSTFSSKVFENKGDGTFQAKATLADVFSGKGQWADFNNDGFKDIIFTGSGGTKIYKNNRNGTFTIQTNTLPTVSNYSAVACGDYDNDGDQDVLLAGLSGSTAITKVFRNEGEFVFAEQTGISLPGISNCSVEWADMDNDGDLDIVIAGADFNFSTKIYDNNGNNTFTEIAGTNFKELNRTSLSIGDYDNDGHRDLIVSGTYDDSDYFTILYRNNKNKTYSEDKSVAFTGIQWGSLNWGDYDNDGDLDLFLCGSVSSGKVSKIYRNNLNVANAQSSAPSMAIVLNKNDVKFTWNKPADDKTPANGLSYNLYVYETSSTGYVKGPESFIQSSAKNGLRLVAAQGSIQYSANGFTLKGLPVGDYKWSLQAVDAGLKGGLFSSEGSFSIVDLSGVSVNLITNKILGTNSKMQFSLSSTDGINGTWDNCSAPSTNESFGNGGYDVWVRQIGNNTNNRKVATIAAPISAPVYQIDYSAETTDRVIPSTDEYSTYQSMANATAGSGVKIPIAPGQTIYFRTKGTETVLPSLIRTLTAPARPAAPAISIDYPNEITAQVITSGNEYSSGQNMDNAITGSGSKLTITPGQNLYFRAKATTSSFCSNIQTLTVAQRPAIVHLSIDFFTETTYQVLPHTYEYSRKSDMSGSTDGNGLRFPVTPGETLYFRIKATLTTFKSEVTTLNVPTRPAAPTNIQVNDNVNYIYWDYVPGFLNPSDYQYSVDGGNSWVLCNSRPINFGDINLPAGAFKLRLHPSNSNFYGLDATSTSALTITGVASLEQAGIRMYPNPASDFLFIENLPENSTVYIYNLQGKILIQKLAESESLKLPVDALPQGLFVIKVKALKGEYQSKFSKQ